MASPIITLATDFGSGSSYVAQVKGLLSSAVPDARLIDVAHDLPPFSVRAGEMLLRGYAFAFPLGTVHLVIIDPGVGTARRPIAVRARGRLFVGPDNGVLGVALAQPGAEVVVLDQRHLWREPVTATFHGRDIFAPVAAELAAGLTLADVGSPLCGALASSLPVARLAPHHAEGEVLMADRFGNLLTNVPAGAVPASAIITAEGRPATRVRTYGDAPPATLLALASSDGYLEIAVREGSAARELGRAEGARIECTWD
jgi:S-adenosylmethionine hydrolase